MLRIYVLAEKPRSDTTHVIRNPFDGILPKRLIDGRVIDEADQIAQLLTILAPGRRRSQSEERSQM